MYSRNAPEPVVFNEVVRSFTSCPSYLSAYTNDDINEVGHICSLNMIEAPEPIDFEPATNEIFRTNNLDDEDTKLASFKRLCHWKDTNRSNPFTRSALSYKFKRIPVADAETEADVAAATLTERMNGDNLLITIRFYRPTRVTHFGRSVQIPTFAEEFKCLGSNYLTEVRDKIQCVSNNLRFYDISENPYEASHKVEYDSGFFFIHDTFYNDMRHPDSVDYSATIINWAKTALGMTDKKFKVADMAETQFFDLSANIGEPYQYLHHGNCEHIFVISQLQYLPDTMLSQQPRIKYPYVRSYNTFNTIMCYICNRRKYGYIVENSKVHLYDPSYLCEVCFLRFHYIDGKKIGEFKALRIFENGEQDLSQQTSDNEVDDAAAEEDDDEEMSPKMEFTDIKNEDIDVEFNPIL